MARGLKRDPATGSDRGPDGRVRRTRRVLTRLDDEQWKLPTPAPGWTIAHQVAHLAATFRMAGLAGSDPDGFVALMARLSHDFTDNVANALSEYLSDPPEVLFGRWQAERNAAVKALSSVPADQMVPWVVYPLPPAVLAMAGMMEAFAHGQDIADALGVRRSAPTASGSWSPSRCAPGTSATWPVTSRTPDMEFGFDLTAPSGALWQFGPEDARQRISGPAEDFCLLVTRRRHRDDLAVTAVGPDAEHWLEIAQAYRGPAGGAAAPASSPADPPGPSHQATGPPSPGTQLPPDRARRPDPDRSTDSGPDRRCNGTGYLLRGTDTRGADEGDDPRGLRRHDRPRQQALAR